MSLYPLLFKPKFVEKIWGGRKIESVLGKSLPADKQIGESWEIYDFPPGVVEGSKDWVSAEIANGPLAGRLLHSMVVEFGAEMLGSVPLAKQGQFPILIKYLDAREDLSVQVHPPQAYADANPGAHLKSEAWYVLQNDPGARLLIGLNAGVTRASFNTAITTGEIEAQIQSIKVKPGDCHYLPSGTVHALGAGILVAEVQTPSDTTFRVYDFKRVDPSTGKERKLHVDEAMECIDFETKPTKPKSAPPESRLVTSPYFHLEKKKISKGETQTVHHAGPVVWMVLEGKMSLNGDGQTEPTAVKRGDSVLLPASLKNCQVTAEADSVWLEVTFPPA